MLDGLGRGTVGGGEPRQGGGRELAADVGGAGVGAVLPDGQGARDGVPGPVEHREVSVERVLGELGLRGDRAGLGVEREDDRSGELDEGLVVARVHGDADDVTVGWV